MKSLWSLSLNPQLYPKYIYDYDQPYTPNTLIIILKSFGFYGQSCSTSPNKCTCILDFLFIGCGISHSLHFIAFWNFHEIDLTFSRSSKFKGQKVNWMAIYDFLYVFHTNFDHNMRHLWDSFLKISWPWIDFNVI